MGSSSKTPIYQLNQWSLSDSPKMEDFNNDNAAIEGALTAHDTQLANMVSIASGAAGQILQAKADGKTAEGIGATLPITRGGTGATTAAAARNALGLGNTNGALPIANGGTGASDVAGARNALGLGNTSGAIPIANGGTGATTVAGARNALGLGNVTGPLPVENGGTGVNNLTGITVGMANSAGAGAGSAYTSRYLRNIIMCTSTTSITTSDGDVVHVYV